MKGLLDRLAAWWIDRRMHEGAEQVIAESGVKLHKASLDPNGFRVDLIAPNLVALLDEAAGLLNAQSAENYIQFEMLPRMDRTNGRPVRVTVQWMDGESPAQQNARLRAEVAQLKAETTHA